jgi:hypothetical protein
MRRRSTVIVIIVIIALSGGPKLRAALESDSGIDGRGMPKARIKL